MGFLSGIGKFVSNVGKGIGKVAGAVVKPVTALADAGLRMVPGIGNIYSTVSNLTGLNLSKVGDLIGGKKQEASPAQETQQAENIIQDLSVNQPITQSYGGGQQPIMSSYIPNPTIATPAGNITYTNRPITDSYENNPLMSKAFVLTGTSNEIITKALKNNGIDIDELASLAAELKTANLL